MRLNQKRRQKGKAIISAKDYGSTKKLTSESTMSKFNTDPNKFQLDLFSGEQPKKVLQTITCFGCEQKRELDGFIFKLVPVCSSCRTEREVEITNNRFERRRAKR